MEIKKCITCHRTKKYKNKSSKDFKCKVCRNKEYKSFQKLNYVKKNPQRKRSFVKKPISIKLREEVITFVYTINKQGGYATTKQIFVDLITLYNDLPKGNLESIQLDTLSVAQQIKYMWDKLKMVSSETL